MRYFLLFIFAISFGNVFGQSDSCSFKISGLVLSLETKEPLAFASIKILGTTKGTVTSENGAFTIENICNDEVDLEIRFLGYKTVVHHHDLHHPDPIIYMAQVETLLQTVIVEGYMTEEIQTLSIQKKDVSTLKMINSSIANITEELSGVSMLKTGSNVSKPMIHGLHSNRVLVINDGLRHAYQVWGQEHAPEIDPSHVGEIEIVKGAGTVKYGPEALGGVILYNSKEPVLHTNLTGSVGSSFQTNGRAVSGQFNLGQGYDRFAWNAGAFGIYQGDLQAPDYNLSNTGKREFGGSFNTLLHQRKFDLKVSGSYFQQELGILRGSLVGNLTDLQNAIERGIPNPTYSRTYEIRNPKQETEHGLIKTDLSFFKGEHIFKFQYGFQQNVRREFDVRRGELNERPVIDLKLWSHTIDAEWVQPTKANLNGNSGLQIFTQNSKNKPESNPANFVPDYQVFNLGAYTIQSLNFNETTAEFGARFDYQSLYTADTIRDVQIYSNTVDYFNVTFTVGLRKKVNANNTLFSNIGTAWRPPNVAELYSFGYHFSRLQFGLWRYTLEPEVSTDEILNQSDRPVPSEKSIKWVTGLEVKRSNLNAEFIVYVNHINNFIFLRPFGVTVNIAGTFPYFIYDQTNALFIGTDWDLKYNHTRHLTSEMKISYVYAQERETKQALLEIPPFNVGYSLDYKKGNWDFGVNLSYTATQWNAPPVIEPIEFQNNNAEVDPDEFFDYMSPPDAFFLVGGKVAFHKKHWNFEVSVQNLLNTPYRLYTDRLRYFADSPGRNISVALEYIF
jgi:iron complex outermembrane receptor protein